MEQQVVVTVEAMRCWQCQRLLHPSEPFFRRQMITAVETGPRIGTVHRHERVTVCADCHAFFEQVEAENRSRAWWGRVWFWGVIAALTGSWFTPYAMATLYAAMIWRTVWKWQAKRRQKRALGQADRKEVPQVVATNDALRD